MKNISFNNSDVSLVLKKKRVLKSFLTSIFEEEQYQFESVSFVFCSDAYLLPLNRKYLNHDTLTDIITFSLSDVAVPVVAEIYISVERVVENAASLNVPFMEELHRVMIHGILHLCGYSDHLPALKKQMRGKEDYFLSRLQKVL